MTFEYTSKQTDFDSSLVEEAYYNTQDKTLAVVLYGGSTYKYSNVPPHVYVDFREAYSPGAYYNAWVKNRYPSEYLGYMNNEDSFFVPRSAGYSLLDGGSTSQGVWVTPKSNTEAAQPAYFDVHGRPVVSTAGEVETNVFPLSTPVTTKRKHVVNFHLADGDNVQGVTRKHTLEAASVDEAIEAVRNIADMLDLEFYIESVTVFINE